MIKQILAVITGYAIFVISSLLFFKFSGINPHAETSLNFMVLTAIYGTVISFISGGITQFISKAKTLKINYILAFIMAGFATFSLFKSNGAHWTQVMAIFIFSPVSILGGYFISKRSK
ncbi:hypothetical protein [Flavobacterium sp.]|uniref:hypothetical protein n=1 Tax=Flavobacterium sp. TaxID=239 RepID=UPI002615740D|nr:hypothetical protein [Flavobacterium sp.]